MAGMQLPLVAKQSTRAERTVRRPAKRKARAKRTLKPVHWRVQHIHGWMPRTVELRRTSRVEQQLLRAAELGNVVGVGQLIQEGVDVNGGQDGTALHRAAAEGHQDVARLLLDHGAHIDACDAWGETPLHAAAGNFWRKGRQEQIVRFLLQHGADATARSFSHWTPLHRCAMTGDCTVATLLLIYGADMDARSKEGWTPLSMAQRDDRLELAALLRRRGAR